jgi:uncharacterized protein YdeI (YjbR/CyaY-like superfamily)
MGVFGRQLDLTPIIPPINNAVLNTYLRMPQLNDDLPQTQAGNRSEWRAWLAENHLIATGVWLVYFKKTSGESYLSYDEMVEEALCFGWVDSKPGTVDASRSMLYFSPRNPKSNWSRPNKERIERLIAAGKMAPKGLEMVELAKKSGTWVALDGVENLEIPDDLQAALNALPKANEYFMAFPRSVKRGILEWIQSAKTPETRLKRIQETASLADSNIRANQYIKK